jgi:hypothetical protein
MTLALVKGQLETADRGPSKAVNKWKVFNDVGEAKDVFGLQDRSFTVLQALLSFYPSDDFAMKAAAWSCSLRTASCPCAPTALPAQPCAGILPRWWTPD